MLLTTTKKKFPKQFKKNCSLCGKEGHKSVDCYSNPENVHKKPGYKAAALTTTSSTPKVDITCHYCNKRVILRNNVLRKREKTRTRRLML
jgi:cobalamin biosynthesis Co2+ chelatase CbiK